MSTRSLAPAYSLGIDGTSISDEPTSDNEEDTVDGMIPSYKMLRLYQDG